MVLLQLLDPSEGDQTSLMEEEEGEDEGPYAFQEDPQEACEVGPDCEEVPDCDVLQDQIHVLEVPLDQGVLDYVACGGHPFLVVGHVDQ